MAIEISFCFIRNMILYTSNMLVIDKQQEQKLNRCIPNQMHLKVEQKNQYQQTINQASVYMGIPKTTYDFRQSLILQTYCTTTQKSCFLRLEKMLFYYVIILYHILNLFKNRIKIYSEYKIAVQKYLKYRKDIFSSPIICNENISTLLI